MSQADHTFMKLINENFLTINNSELKCYFAIVFFRFSIGENGFALILFNVARQSSLKRFRNGGRSLNKLAFCA